MITKKVTVGVEEFDARAIALCVQTASQYEAYVSLSDGVKTLPAKSIMSIMAMGLALGDEVSVIAKGGSDEEAAASAVAAFLEGK